MKDASLNVTSHDAGGLDLLPLSVGGTGRPGRDLAVGFSAEGVSRHLEAPGFEAHEAGPGMVRPLMDDVVVRGVGGARSHRIAFVGGAVTGVTGLGKSGS